MTITSRNRTILTGLAVVCLLLFAYVATIVLIFRSVTPENLQSETNATMVPILFALLTELLFCILSVAILYLAFRKTSSPEVFYFIVFLVAMAFDSIKVFQIFIEVHNASPLYGVLATRITYFGKFLGTLCIFSSGLSISGVQRQKTEIYLGIGLLLSFLLAATVPIDMTTIEKNLVYHIGNRTEIIIAGVLFLGFTLISFALAAIQTGKKDFLLMGLGIALTAAGRELLFYTNDPIMLIVSFLLLIGGVTIFGERTHAVYLWS